MTEQEALAKVKQMKTPSISQILRGNGYEYEATVMEALEATISLEAGICPACGQNYYEDGDKEWHESDGTGVQVTQYTCPSGHTVTEYWTLNNLLVR